MSRYYDTLKPRAIAVSNPGGAPKQYRIQCRQSVRDDWHQHAVVPYEETAKRTLQGLRECGWQVRIIAHRLPTAA